MSTACDSPADLSRRDVQFYRGVWTDRLPDYLQWFEQFNFFELFPLDGGGYLSTMSLLGTLDDLTIADQIIEGKPLRAWGTLGDLDFDAMAVWETAEYDDWLKRLYIMASLSRTWRRTGNVQYLNAVKAHFFDWYRKNPVPRDVPAYLKQQRDNLFLQDHVTGRRVFRTWFDFAPATRAFVMCWTLYLAGEALDDDDWSVFLSSLLDHARLLLANVENWPDMPGNHQSWWAVGLMYLGCLFREMPFSDRAISTADSLFKQHLQGDMADGFTREGSPSYQLFVLMHFREGVATARCNGLNDPVAASQIEKMHDAVLNIIQPDGTVPAINDGYCGDARPVLEMGASLLDRNDYRVFDSANSQPPRWHHACMPTAGLAVARTGWEKRDTYIVLDATRPAGIGKASHAHAGKLGFIYWRDGIQLVGDSGTCNYSDPQKLFGKWYRRARAHSSLMIDGLEDADFLGDWEWERLPECRIEPTQQTPSYVCIDASSDGFMRLEDPVGFRRRLFLLGDGTLIVSDSITSRREHLYEFIFRTTGVLHRLGETGATVSPIDRPNIGFTISLVAGPPGSKIRVESGPFFQRASAIETASVIFATRGTGSFNMLIGLTYHQSVDQPPSVSSLFGDSSFVGLK